MCFSASASFGAGAILSAVGIASVKKAVSRSEMFFASIPLIFAAQQITEGVLWVSLSNPEYASLRQPATYIFLAFAQIVWPFWVPLSVMLMEDKRDRKKIQKILVAIGSGVALYLGYCLVMYHVEANIVGYHISYLQDYPDAVANLVGVLYVIATILPPFFSSHKYMWTLGLAILISYIITAVFYAGYIVSVWCFFASLISIAVYAVIYEIKKQHEHALETESVRSE